jgi:tRNA pseudouridine38-40 synthase
VVVHGAGRTDAGVHALGQVAGVTLRSTLDTATLLRAVNAQLPLEIRVLAVDEAGADFHPRFSPHRKTYRYLIRNSACSCAFEDTLTWHVPEPLDVDRMQQAAAALCGRHDFAAFRSAGSEVSTTVRTVFRSEVRDAAGWAVLTPAQQGRLLAYEVQGDGFLRHMVRAMVGTLVDVGRGWRDAASVAQLLREGTRADAGATAPARGLYLVAVDYD